MKKISDAADRNKGPIADVLDSMLPARGVILEIASGSGQHITYFARRFPHLMWQPSDPDPECRISILAYLEHSGLSNVRAPLDLDTTKDAWPPIRTRGIVCINMAHIAPWSATIGLLDKAAGLLDDEQRLFLYGPYRLDGEFNAPTNRAFDASLRARNESWGLRDVREVEQAASASFRLLKTIEMPANNYLLVFERYGSSGQSGSRPRK